MVKWNAELDLILIQEIIKANNVTVGKDLRQKIADVIGDGCTAKAVEGRISTLKILKGRTNGGNAAPNTPAKSTPGKGAAKDKTPGTGKSTSKKRKLEEDADNEPPLSPTPALSRTQRNRTQAKYTDPSTQDEGGPVKHEPYDSNDVSVNEYNEQFVDPDDSLESMLDQVPT